MSAPAAKTPVGPVSRRRLNRLCLSGLETIVHLARGGRNCYFCLRRCRQRAALGAAKPRGTASSPTEAGHRALRLLCNEPGARCCSPRHRLPLVTVTRTWAFLLLPETQLSPEDCPSVRGFSPGPSPPLPLVLQEVGTGETPGRRVRASAVCWCCAPHRGPAWPPGLEEGGVLAAGFPGGRAGGEQGDPGATARQGTRDGDLGPQRTRGPRGNAPSITEKLTARGDARVKSNFQTQVDDCPAGRSPNRPVCPCCPQAAAPRPGPPHRARVEAGSHERSLSWARFSNTTCSPENMSMGMCCQDDCEAERAGAGGG